MPKPQPTYTAEFNRSAIYEKSARHLFAQPAVKYQFIADQKPGVSYHGDVWGARGGCEWVLRRRVNASPATIAEKMPN